MCYGMGCRYEYFSGECGKPSKNRCPQDMVTCDGCGEDFWEEELVDVVYKRDNLPAIVCQDCADDEDIFKEV